MMTSFFCLKNIFLELIAVQKKQGIFCFKRVGAYKNF